jgi:mannose-6-phosphate isomerase-like protein (cupin superfamily)
MPMIMRSIQVKGLHSCLVPDDYDPNRLRFHVSEVEAGSRSHGAHAHAGIEAFIMIEGRGMVEVDGERRPIGPNEAVVVEGSLPHGIVNDGPGRMRYLVIIAP